MFLMKSPTLAHATVANKCGWGGGGGFEVHVTYIHEVKEG